jgi:hypothetical protein
LNCFHRFVKTELFQPSYELALRPVPQNIKKIKNMQFTFKFQSLNKLLPICLAIVTLLLIVYLGQQRSIAQMRSNVTVDFGSPATDTISMSGILHGIDTTKPPDSSIKPLQAKLWI